MSPQRHPRDPVHLGHHGTGRECCARTRSTSGGAHNAEILGSAPRRLYTTLPLFHINALNTSPRPRSPAPASLEPRFSASALLADGAASGATVIYLLGAMVPILLAQPANPGGACASRPHRPRPGRAGDARRLSERRRAVIDGYGSTETNFVIASAPDRPRPGYIGWCAGLRCRIVDANDIECPPGEPGELIVRADPPYDFASATSTSPRQRARVAQRLVPHRRPAVPRGRAISSSSTVSRTRSAAAARTSRRSRSSRCSPASGGGRGRGYPVRSELAEDEVMGRVVPGEARVGPASSPRMPGRLPYFAVPRYMDIVPTCPSPRTARSGSWCCASAASRPTTWDRGRPKGLADAWRSTGTPSSRPSPGPSVERWQAEQVDGDAAGACAAARCLYARLHAGVPDDLVAALRGRPRGAAVHAQGRPARRAGGGQRRRSRSATTRPRRRPTSCRRSRRRARPAGRSTTR